MSQRDQNSNRYKLNRIKLWLSIAFIFLLVACTNSATDLQEVPPELDTLASNVVESRVSAGTDDVEEEKANGKMHRGSSDLEMVEVLKDGSTNLQIVGLRFTDIDVPSDASITNAYIEFTVDRAGSDTAKLSIAGIRDANPPTFPSETGYLYSRWKTDETLLWRPDPWTSVGATERTDDISNIVQELVNLSDWTSGNAMAFVVRGPRGTRVAKSFEGSTSGAPLLHIEYSTAYQQDSNGLVQIEAENYQENVSQNSQSWQLVSDSAAQGNEAMQALPDNGINNASGYTTNSPRLDYRVNFTRSGTHYVWVRGKPKSGPTSSSNSVHVGFNGDAVSSADDIDGSFDTAYTWSNDTMDGPVATVSVPSAGVHTVNVWMREDGYTLDALELSSSSSYAPNGVADSPQTCTPEDADWYIDAANGSNSNSGMSENNAFKTLRRAAREVGAGDLVYVLPGVYKEYSALAKPGDFDGKGIFRANGTNSAPIRIEGYPCGGDAIIDGDTPIGDLGYYPELLKIEGDYYEIRNLHIRNGIKRGLVLRNSNNSLVQDIYTHDNGDDGVYVLGDNNVIENIESFGNTDANNPNTDSPTSGDGIKTAGNNNRISRCRVYNNGDDGVDIFNATNVLVEHCVSYGNGWNYNGSSRSKAGDGMGFKMGSKNVSDSGNVVRYSIGFGNRVNNFTNNTGGGLYVFNNTAFNPGERADFELGSGSSSDIVARNSVSVSGDVITASADDISNNSWNLNIDANYISLNCQDPNFLKLPADSPARGAGTDNADPFTNASGDDLGAVQYGQSFADLGIPSSNPQDPCYVEN